VSGAIGWPTTIRTFGRPKEIVDVDQSEHATGPLLYLRLRVTPASEVLTSREYYRSAPNLGATLLGKQEGSV